MENEYKPTKKEKLLVYGIGTALCLITFISGIGYTNYKDNLKLNKIREAKVLSIQISNVAKVSATLPLFRDTDYFKKVKEMSIVKVSQSELPKTITPNNINFAGAGASPYVTGWTIKQGGSTVATIYSPGAWSVGTDFSIAVPTGSIGLYTAEYETDDADDPGFLTAVFGTFKIVPPCPTLTISKS
jgi:hypothetical protein